MSDTTNPHHAGDPPTKSAGSLSINVGLVQIPCAIYPGTCDPVTPKRHSFTEDGHEIGRLDYDKTTGKVYKGTVVKKATASNGEDVELTDDEIAAITGTRDGSASIEKFVPLSALLDGTYVPTSMQWLAPIRVEVKKRKVPNASAAKSLRLLFEYMAERNVGALIRYTPSRTYARWALIMPDGRLLQLAFAEQIRPNFALPDVVLDPREKQMGTILLDTVEIGTPVLENTVGAQLQAFVDSKATGEAPKQETTAMDETGTVDLMAALEASLAAATQRQPAASSAPAVPAEWATAQAS